MRMNGGEHGMGYVMDNHKKAGEPWFPTFWSCVHKSLWATTKNPGEPWPPTFWSCVHNGIRAYVYFATQNNMIPKKQGNRKVGIHGPLFFKLQNAQSTTTHNKTDTKDVPMQTQSRPHHRPKTYQNQTDTGHQQARTYHQTIQQRRWGWSKRDCIACRVGSLLENGPFLNWPTSSILGLWQA